MSRVDKVKAIRLLRDLLKPGDCIYTTVLQVSRDGTSRGVKLVLPFKERRVTYQLDGTSRTEIVWVVRDISWLVWLATGICGYDPSPGRLVVGGGQDVCSDVLYNLGRVLWPNGFRHNKRTQRRNGDTNTRGKDGGFALTQCSL